MKYLIILLFVFIIESMQSYSQEKDSLIQLYPGIGDTLNKIERDYFNLYPNINGFDCAVFFTRENKYLVAQMAYQNNGELQDTSVISGLYKLGIIRKEIEQGNMFRIDEENYPRSVTILSLTGNGYKGDLKSFNSDYLFLKSESSMFESSMLVNFPSTDSRFKISSSNVESVAIHRNSYVLQGLSIGAVGGFIIGAMIGYFRGDWFGYTAEEMALSFGIAGAIIGGLGGLGIGISLTQGDYIIQFKSQNDVLKLNNYAPYYSGSDESIKEKYYEVK